MNTILVVGLGGALGAVFRYVVGLGFIGSQINLDFPWATLVVNVLGCFLIGLIFQLAQGYELGLWLPFLTIGFLGGFTTFSTFGYEAINLFQYHRYYFLLMYVLASNIVGLAAVFFGMRLSKMILQS